MDLSFVEHLSWPFGHDDTDSSDNLGILRGLVDFVSSPDTVLKEHLERGTVFKNCWTACCQWQGMRLWDKLRMVILYPSRQMRPQTCPLSLNLSLCCATWTARIRYTSAFFFHPSAVGHCWVHHHCIGWTAGNCPPRSKRQTHLPGLRWSMCNEGSHFRCSEEITGTLS